MIRFDPSFLIKRSLAGHCMQQLRIRTACQLVQCGQRTIQTGAVRIQKSYKYILDRDRSIDHYRHTYRSKTPSLRLKNQDSSHAVGRMSLYRQVYILSSQLINMGKQDVLQ